MYTTKNHHPLLFSKWFPYFWKWVFKRTKGSYHQDFYGNAKKGYFCKLENGITYKIFKHSQHENVDPTFAVYIYHHDKLVMKYNTYSDSYIDIVFDNPFSYTLDEQIGGLIDALKKSFPEDSLSIFDDTPMHFEKIPVFSFRVCEPYADFKWNYKVINIKKFLDPSDRNKYNHITIVRRYTEYFSARHKYSFSSYSTGFSKGFDNDLVTSFQNIDNYTSGNRYYILYDLTPPEKLDRLYGYDSIIVDEHTKGFLLESDYNYFYFIFNYGFISFHNYHHRGREKAFEIIKNDESRELAFAKKLKETMLELQKEHPSISFCTYLNELGIEGVNITKRKPLTDDQWLLYEMMSI